MTPVAALGPWFCAWTVKVTVSPTRIPVVGATDFVTSTSASVSTVVSAVAVLLPGVGSVVRLDTVAISTIGLGVVSPGGTRRLVVMVCVAPGANAPRAQGKAVV